MFIYRAELANAFRLKAAISDFSGSINQPDAGVPLAAFLNNEDNKKNLSLDYYKRIGSTVTCYQSKTNINEAYVIITPPLPLALRTFTVSPQGEAAEIYGEDTPVGLLASLTTTVANAGALRKVADDLFGARQPRKQSRLGEEAGMLPKEIAPLDRELRNDWDYLDKNGSPQLSALIGESLTAKSGELSKKIREEISSIESRNKNALQAQIEKIKADYNIAAIQN
jgi:hypothetical protein